MLHSQIDIQSLKDRTDWPRTVTRLTQALIYHPKHSNINFIPIHYRLKYLPYWTLFRPFKTFWVDRQISKGQTFLEAQPQCWAVLDVLELQVQALSAPVSLLLLVSFVSNLHPVIFPISWYPLSLHKNYLSISLAHHNSGNWVSDWDVLRFCEFIGELKHINRF